MDNFLQQMKNKISIKKNQWGYLKYNRHDICMGIYCTLDLTIDCQMFVVSCFIFYLQNTITRAFMVSLTLVNMLLLNRLVVDPVARYVTSKTYNKAVLILDFSCFVLLLLKLFEANITMSLLSLLYLYSQLIKALLLFCFFSRFTCVKQRIDYVKNTR